jgi:tagatose 6-phosphate kinase
MKDLAAKAGKILAINLNPAIDKVYAIDDFAVGGVFRPREMTATAGGKGSNVARVSHLLGETVIATGFIGGGNGRFLAAKTRESGVDAQFMQIEAESRICIAVMDQKRHTSTEILEAGPTITPAQCEQFVAHYQRLFEDCRVVTASGSLPRGVPADFYRKLIAQAKTKNIRFILDSSGAALAAGLQELPFMIKPNLEEAEKLVGRDLTTLEDRAMAVWQLRQKGVELPCITLGKNGCIAALTDGVYHFFSPTIEVLNTVGSGDSFVAGCAVGLVRNLPPPEIIRLGMACGMANTQFFATGMISLELVERFQKQIRYQVILK